MSGQRDRAMTLALHYLVDRIYNQIRPALILPPPTRVAPSGITRKPQGVANLSQWAIIVY